jgi:hypothetical protein
MVMHLQQMYRSEIVNLRSLKILKSRVIKCYINSRIRCTHVLNFSDLFKTL